MPSRPAVRSPPARWSARAASHRTRTTGSRSSARSVTAWPRSKIRRSHQWLVSTPAERQWWKRFLRTVRGRWKPFLLPTWRPDLTLFAQPGDGADVLLVREDYLDEWFPSAAHRRLLIEPVAKASGRAIRWPYRVAA